MTKMYHLGRNAHGNRPFHNPARKGFAEARVFDLLANRGMFATPDTISRSRFLIGHLATHFTSGEHSAFHQFCFISQWFLLACSEACLQ